MANIAAALYELFEPMRMLALFAGMLAGLIFGLLPGLGGVATVSILLPFIFLFDSYAGLALLLGAISVIYTSDTITSVLVGAPGSPASAPTAIEGHAMAKEGNAATALGLGFLSSMVGGLVGAVTLAVAIPVAGPIVLALGTPELFMFALIGLYFASSMVGKDIVVGLLAACVGIFLGVVGAAPAAANYRFTFGQPYLMDGLSLTIVALGLFAIAEVIGMLAGGGGISSGKQVISNWSTGFTSFWRNKWLVLRGAIIGTLGGFVPAVGANASTWVAYGHAMSTTKDKSRFGKGEERGIAASEGANNATVISDLVPTLLFSVPGGPAAAIFLGALFSFGFYPGPRMVAEQPVLMYLIVWSVAIASVIGAVVCFAVTPLVARLTQIRFGLIAAPLLLIMIAGAYQATQSLGDIALLLILGIIGWLMKQAEWPRAPVLVGFVLAGPMEQYFWLTNQLHGWSWLYRPGVIILASFIVIPLLYKGWVAVQERVGGKIETREVHRKETNAESLILISVVFPVFLIAAYYAFGYRPSARMLPLLAILPGIFLAAIVFVRELRILIKSSDWPSFNSAEEILPLLLVVSYGFGIFLLGLNAATIIFLVIVLFGYSKMRLLPGLIYGVVLMVGINGMFWLMRISPPEGYLFDWNII